MGLFSLAPNPSPPHGPVWWNQPCSDECCTFPVSTAPVCAGEEEGWPLPSRDSSVGWGRGERCTYSTQSAYAEAIDSLARTRKLPSLPTLESRSSALERVMLPWYQHWSIAGAGENLNANTGAARAACVSVCNDQAASAHQLPVSIAQRGKGNSATDNFLNSHSSESQCDISLQPPFSLFMLLLKWLASPCSLPFPPALCLKVPAGDLFCSLTDSVPQALVACHPIYDLLPDPFSSFSCLSVLPTTGLHG